MASYGSALPNASTQVPTGNPTQLITPPPYGGSAPPGTSNTLTGYQALAHNNPDYSDDEADEFPEPEEYAEAQNLSAITITIHCPLHIKGDGNIVAVDTSVSVGKIAQGVVSSLKQMSMSGHGVPMIDQDGRPRPITINAKAEVKVTGCKNVIGEQGLGSARPLLSPRVFPKPVAAAGNKDGAVAVKRERDEEAEGDSKRTRLG